MYDIYGNNVQDEGVAYLSMLYKSRQWCVDGQYYCKHGNLASSRLPPRSEVWDVAVLRIGQCGDQGDSVPVWVVVAGGTLNPVSEHGDTVGECEAAVLRQRVMWCKLCTSLQLTPLTAKTEPFSTT